MKRQIGLDFSTTTTVVAYQDRDNDKNSKPEVLFFNGNSYVPTVIMEEGTLTNKKGIEIHYDELFGWDAENKAQNNAYSLLKSNFKMGLISEKREERQKAEKLTEKFLHYLYEYYTNHADHPKNTSMDISTVVTYPAKFSETVQRFLKNAAEKAGFTNVILLDESKSAMAYSLAYETETIKKYVESLGKQKLKVMLIDMGAGTTDIAVFEYDIADPTNFSHICSWPKTNGVTFGGGEVDEILCDFYERKLGKEITSMIGKGNSALGEKLLRSQVKKYKEDVLSKLDEEEETTYLPGSLDYMTNAEEAYLDRGLFEDLLKEYLSKFPKLVNGALKEAEMTSEQVDMVLLTGGHSQWYFVKKMLIEQGISGNSIFDFSDPHLVVAKGAALYVEKGKSEVETPVVQKSGLQNPKHNNTSLKAISKKKKAIARVKKQGYWQYIDENGKLISNKKWVRAEDFSENLALVEDEQGNLGYIDKSGTIVIDISQYSSASSFHDGLAYVQVQIWNGGYIDKSGNLVIHLEKSCKDIKGDFHCGLARTSQGYINKQGKIVIPRGWEYMEDFHDGIAWVKGKASHARLSTLIGALFWGAIDTKGNLVIPKKFDSYPHAFKNGISLVNFTFKSDVIIDKNGNVVTIFDNEDWAPSINSTIYENFLRVDNKKWNCVYGFADVSGNLRIPCVWDAAGDFHEGLASVYKDEKWGYIDKEGKEVIERKWYGNTPPGIFSNNLASVFWDGKWGYINRVGEVVIPYQYEYAGDFIKVE